MAINLRKNRIQATSSGQDVAIVGSTGIQGSTGVQGIQGLREYLD